MANRTITIDKQEYEIPSQFASDLSAFLTMAWSNLGEPDDLFTENGKKLMKVIIASWQDVYPVESYNWLEMRKEYKSNEMSISQQVKQQTGRSLASVPSYIFLMMKKFYKNKHDRKFFTNLVKEFPMFMMCNKY